MRPLPNLSKVTPRLNLHAHNDSSNADPLYSALSLGYTSIEADVRLIKNELYAEHDQPWFLSRAKKLTTSYLDPLLAHFQKTAALYPDFKKPIFLMLDVKTDAVETYRQIEKTLIPYHNMLSSWKANKSLTKSISILISGNCPTDLIAQQDMRWAQVDGRINDIGRGYSKELMPLISEDYRKLVSWHIFRRQPNVQQLARIKVIADAIHGEGKRFRLWKNPKNEFVSELLFKQGVDVLTG